MQVKSSTSFRGLLWPAIDLAVREDKKLNVLKRR